MARLKRAGRQLLPGVISHKCQPLACMHEGLMCTVSLWALGFTDLSATTRRQRAAHCKQGAAAVISAHLPPAAVTAGCPLSLARLRKRSRHPGTSAGRPGGGVFGTMESEEKGQVKSNAAGGRFEKPGLSVSMSAAGTHACACACACTRMRMRMQARAHGDACKSRQFASQGPPHREQRLEPAHGDCRRVGDKARRERCIALR